MKKNAVYGLLLVGALLAQGTLQAVETPVLTPAPAPQPAIESCCACPCTSDFFNAVKEHKARTAAIIAAAAVGIAFYAVYDKDQTLLENLKNFPSNLWIRLNNAIAAAQKSKKCY